LASFEAKMGENRGFLGPKQRAKWWRFWDDFARILTAWGQKSFIWQ
jgi:hypothetical protein